MWAAYVQTINKMFTEIHNISESHRKITYADTQFESVMIIINNFMSTSNNNQRKVRAASARPLQGRPSSGKAKKPHQKTQFIENVYSNPISNYHSFHKNKIFSMRSNMQEPEQQDISKLIPRTNKMTKDREELFEENLHLKQQVNKLKDELARNRTKIENLVSKNQRYTKQFNREFQKKMYWNGPNSYMISGVKAQYQKLKEQYDEKQQECNILRRQLIESGTPELKVYAETLVEENKSLIEKLNRMSQISEQILLDSDGQKVVPDYIFNDLKKKNDKLSSKLEQSQFLLKEAREQKKEHRRKTQFLQKLIIEKDNSQYNAQKKAKKLEREKNELQQKYKSLQDELEDMNRIWEQKLEKVKMTENKKFETEKSMFDRTLAEKDQKIRSLEKEVAYLSTLLTYWKPLDELNKEMGNKMDESRQDYRNQSSHGSDAQNQESYNHYMNPSIAMSKKRKPSQNLNQSLKGGDFLMNMSRQMQNAHQENKKERVQQTADERHSEDAQKKRKVDIREVEHFGEHLRYRLLGLKLTMDDTRNYFDFREDRNEAEFILASEQDVQWHKQYITMKEIKQILMSQPFQLNEEDSHLLARYLIEDSDKQYVYCDLKNENKRSIVKSIIRSLIGNYEILNEARQEAVEKECEIMMERYSTNLISALSSMASSGYISRKKFIELINSLGIELSEQGKDYLVCKMLLQSASLSVLNYTVLF